MDQIPTEYDRLFSLYGPPTKPPLPWKVIHPTPGTSIAKPVKMSSVKNRSNAPGFPEQKSV